MICPKCLADNPPDSQACGLCHEVLIRTMKLGGGVIKIYGDAFDSSMPGASPSSNRPPASPPPLVKPGRAKHVLLIFLGLGAIAAGIAYYRFPSARPRLDGVQFKCPSGLKQPLVYLIETKSDSRSWAEYNGQLDTPLLDGNRHETGSVSVEPALRSKAPEALVVRAREWIRSVHIGETDTQQAVPATHPTLASARIVLGPKQTLRERQGSDTIRLGRAVNFIFPRFPDGVQRPGDTWTETVRWADVLGEWKIVWQANMKWTFEKYDTCYDMPCARLSYQAELIPQRLDVPDWARKLTRKPAFAGQASGEALYDPKNNWVLSNTISYHGNLSIPISSLESIPWEQRVGRPLTAEPGTIVIRFNEKTVIHSL